MQIKYITWTESSGNVQHMPLSLSFSPSSLFSVISDKQEKGGAAARARHHGKCSATAPPTTAHSDRRELNSHKTFHLELGNRPPANHLSEPLWSRPLAFPCRLSLVASSCQSNVYPPVVASSRLSVVQWSVQCLRRPAAADPHQRMWIK